MQGDDETFNLLVSKLYEGSEIPWDTLLTPNEQLIKAAANGNNEKVKILLEENANIINEK